MTTTKRTRAKKAAPFVQAALHPAQDRDTPPADAVLAIKGFDRDWKCRGYQFAVGGTYHHDGDVLACSAGFHAIEGYPLEVFDYYPPATSRYAEVRQWGALSRQGKDSKLASASISVGTELHIPEIVRRAVEWVMARTKPVDGNNASGPRSAVQASGYASAVQASGDASAVQASGKHSVVVGAGENCRVMGADTCALMAVERNPRTGAILSIACGIVGRDGLKAGVWYRCAGGALVEVA